MKRSRYRSSEVILNTVKNSEDNLMLDFLEYIIDHTDLISNSNKNGETIRKQNEDRDLGVKRKCLQEHHVDLTHKREIGTVPGPISVTKYIRGIQNTRKNLKYNKKEV